MSKITSYPPGAPCWVDLGTTDVAAAQAFYSELFDWTYAGAAPGGAGYQMCYLGAHPVAGMWTVMPEVAASGMPAAWTTYLACADLDATAAAVQEHGGTLLHPVTEANDQGRLATAADPSGAVFGLWQPGELVGSGLVGEPGSFSWTELLTRDLDRAWQFYAALFGYQREEMDIGQPTPYLVATIDGEPVLGMMSMPEPVGPEVPSYWSCYFAVADADASLRLALDRGGSMLVPPTDSGFGRWTVLRDPQGAVLTLIRPAEADPQA